MSSNPLWDEFVRAYDEEMRDKVSEKVRKEVSEKERVFSIKKIMEKFRVSAESAMDTLAIPESEWARYKAML